MIPGKWIAGLAAFVATALVGFVVAAKHHHRTPEEELRTRVAKAVAAKDRAELTLIAALLRKGGHEALAASVDAELAKLGKPALKGAASNLRAAEAWNEKGAPPEGVVMSDSGTPEDPHRALAQFLTDHLKTHPRGKEDQSIVRKFQDAEKLNRDGRYGPGASTRILQRYGIIPEPPYYWAKGPMGRIQKKKYLDFVKSYATGDPERGPQYEALIKRAERS